MKDINGYKLSRNWFNFCFENPEIIKPVYTALYFYILEQWNRFGKKEKFGLPTLHTMEAIGVKSKNTYYSAFNFLIENKFITLIQKSKNQNTANIISISATSNNKSALDSALIQQISQREDSEGVSVVPIDKPITNNQKTIKERKQVFYTQISETVKEKRHKYSEQKTDLRDFYEYWTEHGINDKKMRFEKEKSFGIARRLDTWFKNKTKFDKEEDNNQPYYSGR